MILAHELGVENVNVIHFIDGDDAVNKDDNLIYYPNLLVRHLRSALYQAEILGTKLQVSPASMKILDEAGSMAKG